MDKDINYTLFGYVIESKITLILVLFGGSIGTIVLIAVFSAMFVRNRSR
jgi:hypothetical protein